MKRWIALACVALSILVMQTPPAALACSGGAEFRIEELVEMDILIRATVLETDDRGFNSILRVEEYYKGDGGSHLTLMRYDVGLSSGRLVRGYDTACLYAGDGAPLVVGSQLYFGLNSNGNGTYNDYYALSRYFPRDGMMYSGLNSDSHVLSEDYELMTEDDFVAYLLELGGRTEPLLPDPATSPFYPLMRFLNLTTEDGTRYRINPDRSITQLTDADPLAISPDGAHVAFRLNERQIGFQYIFTTLLGTPDYDDAYPGIERLYTVDGTDLAFSNDSNLVAVWNNRSLKIYMLGSNIYGSDYGFSLEFFEIGSIELDLENMSPHVKWSADSSTIFWQDNSGIRRWNLINDAESQLAISTEDIMGYGFESPELLDVSTYGRFVRVGDVGNWSLIDTQTGEMYANAMVSPTEQFFVFFGRVDNLEQTAEIMGEGSCRPPLRETCFSVIYDGEIDDGVGNTLGGIMPYDLNMFRIILCSSQQTDECLYEVQSWHPLMAGRHDLSAMFFNRYYTDARQVIYDSQYSQPAIQLGDYTLLFDNYFERVESQQDILDLEAIIDSPIAHIEWGQPIFYDRYRMTTTNFMP